MLPLNHAIFLYNRGENQEAAKQFAVFEQRYKEAKEGTLLQLDRQVSYW